MTCVSRGVHVMDSDSVKATVSGTMQRWNRDTEEIATHLRFASAFSGYQYSRNQFPGQWSLRAMQKKSYYRSLPGIAAVAEIARRDAYYLYN